jgi:hypothetical protein
MVHGEIAVAEARATALSCCSLAHPDNAAWQVPPVPPIIVKSHLWKVTGSEFSDGNDVQGLLVRMNLTLQLQEDTGYRLQRVQASGARQS